MSVLVPSGQSSQLVGLPALSDQTYKRLDQSLKEIYSEYVAAVENTATGILPVVRQSTPER